MAHDESGATVQAAASLFGGEDNVAGDFFSSSLEDSQSNEQPTEGASPPHCVSSDTSNLFEAGPGDSASSLFESSSYDAFSSTNATQWPAQQSQTPLEVSSQDTHAETHVEYGSTVQQEQGWQDEYGQWQQYNSTTSYLSTHDYASHTSSSNDPYISQSFDEAAQQASAYGSYDSATNYATSQNTCAPQQTYDPQRYAPPPPLVNDTPSSTFTSSYNPATTTSSTYGQPMSSTYTPPSTTYTPAYAASTYNAYTPSAFPPNTSTVNGPSIPSPPTPLSKDVSAYRSSTRNAYDPPIPSKSRVKSRHVSYASTTLPNNQYQQYQAPIQPPPPLPAVPSIPVAPSNYTSVQSHAPYSSKSYVSIEHQPAVSTAPPSVAHRMKRSTPSLREDIAKTETYEAQTSKYDGGMEAEHHGSASEAAFDWRPQSTDNSVVDPEGGLLSDYADETGFAENEFATVSAQEPIADGEKTAIPSAFGAYGMSPPPLPTSSPDSVKSSGSWHKTNNQTDPYNPAKQSHPYSFPPQSAPQQQRPPSTTPWDPYAPPTTANKPNKRSSQSSLYGGYGAPTTVNGIHAPTGINDSFVPKAAPQRSASRQSFASYDAGYATQANATISGTDDVGYATVTASYNQGPYAPSPSLLGTNDPLGRTSVKIPVISFGFGGKFVSCFHSSGETASGFDVSLTSRQSTSVSIRTLHEIISASAMDSSTSYPGPLYSDPGPSTLSLARTVGVGTSGNIKAKKTAVSKWLEEQAEELTRGIAHIPTGSQDRHNAEGRLALIRLLKVMVDHDGQLSGSPETEWTVRKALIPRLENESSPDGGIKDLTVPGYGSTFGDLNEQPLAVYTLKASALDRIREFLIRGQRREAYHYAIDEKLWAHAMIIASSVNAQSWQEVVKEFVRSELGTKQSLLSFADGKPDSGAVVSNGRESLRVAYGLFAGHGASSVQELVPTGKDSTLSLPGLGAHTTPISPNFPQPTLTSSVPPESLAKWQETAAMMAFSQTPGDSAALTALGDYLAANRWIEAAHACYLLSPRTSAFGGAGIPSVRMVLVGSESPASQRGFFRDLDVTLLSEVIEFALSLSTSKNQEGFGGLPHLQAYKLIRASHLAEMGYVETANRYCEAIGTSIRSSNRGSQFYTPTFIGELKNLSDRLTAAPQVDKTASWISKKMTKPSLDTLGSWLEGSFSKLIIGEGEESVEQQATDASQASKSAYGPFSHYSTISSAATSAIPSRTSTPYLPPVASGTPPVPFVPASHGPVDRAASAMDHLRPERHRASPVQRVASASAATTTFSEAFAMSQYQTAMSSNDMGSQEVPWWGSNSQDRSGPTPTATTFHKVDENESEKSFISLMDGVSVGPTAAMSQAQKHSPKVAEFDDEDLGFGNSSIKKTKESAAPSDAEDEKKTEDKPKEEPQKPELKQQSSSWLSRWWYRGSNNTTPAPIKANLGEETSFYYDKELKRWVNKKVGTPTTPPPPPPPPPSRPKTAGPSTDFGGGSGGSVSTTPPPPRASSAAELSGPPRKPPRARSNLVPKEESSPIEATPTTPGSAPPTATSFETSRLTPDAGPPIGRPKSAAAKRNVRSRYVDVFQQQ